MGEHEYSLLLESRITRSVISTISDAALALDPYKAVPAKLVTSAASAAVCCCIVQRLSPLLDHSAKRRLRERRAVFN